MTTSYNTPYPGPVDQPAKNGLAVGALIVGIIGCVLSFTFCLSWLGIILGIIGVILGIIAITNVKRDPRLTRGLPIAGIVASVAAVIIGISVYSAAVIWGGEVLQYGLVEGHRAQADQLAAEARAAGVDEQIIQAARDELEATLSTVTSDYDDMERAAREVEAAMQEYRQALEAAQESSEEMPDEMPEEMPDE